MRGVPPPSPVIVEATTGPACSRSVVDDGPAIAVASGGVFSSLGALCPVVCVEMTALAQIETKVGYNLCTKYLAQTRANTKIGGIINDSPFFLGSNLASRLSGKPTR
jgi:hypothetical protein